MTDLTVSQQIDNLIASTTAPAEGAIHDTHGLDLGAEVDSIDSQITRIEGELAEQKFDPKTGKPSLVREGRDRSDREMKLSSLKNARTFQVARNAELQSQRDANANAKVTAERELAAKHAYTQGDPVRAAALDKAIADEEAKEAARLIVAARRS